MQQMSLFHYDISDFDLEVETFNIISGNLKNVNYDSLNLQIKLIEEESKELREAFDNNDKPEILKEAIDLAVVTLGFLQKLQAQGYDVSTAMSVVASNNLDKFPSSKSIADSTVLMNKGWYLEHNEDYNVYVIKDANGKVRKPLDYSKVDLSKFVGE